MQLILASQSPYRRKQLENFGLKFTAISPSVDEEKLKSQGPQDLVELTRFLSEQKARSLSVRFPRDVILGSDQLVDFEGRRLDKPGTLEKAELQLLEMSGKPHRLITSLAILKGEELHLFTDITVIRLKSLNREMVRAYCQVDRPFDCAGAYKIEKAGMSLIDEIQTQDPSAIQGLPLMSLMRGLEKFKITVSHFWS